MKCNKLFLNIKIILFLLALAPLARLLWLGVSDALGANPVEFVIRSLGTWTLAALLVTLSMTPLRLLTGSTWPVRLRRMFGLYAFFYSCLHFFAYVWLDQWFDWSAITADIAKHPYVLVGFSAFVMLIPLAATSNKFMMRILRKRWQALHRAVYLIAVLGVVHYWWLVKKDVREPIIYAAILMALLAARIMLRKSAGAQGSAQAAHS